MIQSVAIRGRDFLMSLVTGSSSSIERFIRGGVVGCLPSNTFMVPWYHGKRHEYLCLILEICLESLLDKAFRIVAKCKRHTPTYHGKLE